MGESHDIMNLEWVQSDIEQTLQQAQENLEACLAGTGEHQQHLKNCYDDVHQVTGSLQMVGLVGATLLAEQMEQLLKGMLDGSVNQVEEAYSALAQALVHLPPYLARTRSDAEESPILLLTAINDIRKVLGTPLLLEYSLFDVQLGEQRPAATEEVKAEFTEHCGSDIKKMRQIFQFALIGLIRNEDTKTNLARVANVLTRLVQDCKGSRINQLWEVAAAMIEGWISDGVKLNTDQIDLLRTADKEIKLLVDSGGAGLDRQPDAELLKSMLFQVAKSRVESTSIQSVKRAYGIDENPLGQGDGGQPGLFVGPDKETLNSVVSALSEELERIKDTIDLYVRNEVKANIDLGGLQPSLNQIASTLVMLNLETPRAMVQEQLNILTEHSSAGTEVPNEKLLQIAEALLYVETELQGIIERTGDAQEDSIGAYAGAASERVILESLSNMKQAKDDIQEFVAGHTDFEQLDNVPNTLRGAYGGLSMLSLSEAAQLVYAVAQYIQDDILAMNKVPEGGVMDNLAEVVATVEYYLEGLAEDKPVGAEILKQAKERIAGLGYPVEQSDGITSDDGWDFGEYTDTPVDSEEAKVVDSSVEEESVCGGVEAHELTFESAATEPPELGSDWEVTAADTEETTGEFTGEDTGQAIPEGPSEESFAVEFELAEESQSLASVEEPLEEDATVTSAAEELELAEWHTETDYSEREQTELQSVTQEQDDELQSAGADGQEETLDTDLSTDSEVISGVVEVTGSGEAVEEVIDAAQTPEAEAVAEEEDLVDDEIREIFTEEAEEVFEVINEYWPRYVNDYSDNDALQEVRRAFHTLKGSGRMVQAAVIGELAWSVENLLNQVIDKVLVMNSAIVQLVEEIRAELPVLLKHFVERSHPSVDVDAWMTRAEQLLAGELPVQGTAEVVDVTAPEMEESAVEAAEAPFEAVADAEGGQEEGQEFVADNELQPPEQADTQVESVEEVVDYAPPEQGLSLEEDDDDASLEEIFCGEAVFHIAVIDNFIQDYHNAVEDIPVTDELNRALHTLKGSAYMASLTRMAELAAAGESLVKELRNHALPVDQEVVTFLDNTKQMLQLGLEQLTGGRDIDLPQAQELIQAVPALIAARVGQSEVAEQQERSEASPVQKFLQENINTICDLHDEFEQWQQQAGSEQGSTGYDMIITGVASLNRAAKEAEQQEIETLLATLEYVYRTLDGLNLKLSARMLEALVAGHEGLISLVDQLAAGQQPQLLDSLAAELDNALNELQQTVTDEKAVENAAATVEEIAVVEDAADPVDQLPVPELPDEVLAEAAHTAPVEEEFDQELIEIFLAEADEIMEATSEAKQKWIEAPGDLSAVDALQRGLHTLKGSSRMAGITAVGDLSHELESIYEDVNAGRINASQELFDLVHECDDSLSDMITELRNGAACTPAMGLISRIRAYHDRRLRGEDAPFEEAVEQPARVIFDTGLGGTVDADAGQIAAFFSVADKLLEGLGKTISAESKKEGISVEVREQVLESLGQVQAKAYEAGVHEVGDLCHVFSELAANLSEDELNTPATVTEFSDWYDRIESSYLEAKSAATGEVTAVQPPAVAETAKRGGAAEQAQGKETVRVPASLLEHLVDLAGETSVSRSRVEQQVSNFGYAIDEIGSTVERLREQLRRMEIETEAQILFGQEREGPAHEGFDPLEMDRYSRIQELSRALVESVSDLFDLKDTLHDRARYTETLLLQQSRINTELQEGLMKTRMVPFSRMVPRLRRVVRQVSSELGKKVDFQVKNIDTELDRSLLEHMTAPLEHMLRNAVDHGVELPKERTAAGKADTGLVELELSRDGGDILLTLRDDGAGIKVDSVRSKAVEKGLIAADANLSDHEVLQFIMEAGFSTAAQVTQISGRGVGMDVVSSEIKQLGGSIEIDSKPGEGTRFTVRVPFTVSINRALMVTIGEEVYALPLSTIEGVVRVTPYELEEYYRPEGPDFEYAGERYDLHYLGEYLGHGNSYQLQNNALPLPVVLIRTAEHTAAIQVDSVSGSREIVVKPLGPQLGVIPGMSGATILGDGRVVLILDMAAMIRSRVAHQGVEQELTAPIKVSGNLQVMVVDDSVTVRKVASRLLERHGMDVVIAKDGVEAMTKLQDTLPDIMLLDIEMPRMDGFELASFMRNDERLQEVPIIMITSRTGDKHRERAREIGVNRFMGKPFQEDELLDTIAELTDFNRGEVAQG